VGLARTGLGIDVIRDGVRIFDPARTFTYEVAAECSGIRSLTVLLALTTIYGFMTFRTPWKKVLMIVIALPLAIVGNVVRLLGIIVVRETFGDAASMTFHEYGGFFTFGIALAVVMLLGHYLDEDRRRAPLNPQPV